MSAAPSAPPKDELQSMLDPLQAADPSEFRDHLGPEAPSLDETLQWEPDGLPTWWPKHRPAEDGDPWSSRERRTVLLRNLREHLPSRFPDRPRSSAEKQQIVDSLRRTLDGLRSRASHILSSS